MSSKKYHVWIRPVLLSVNGLRT